MTLSHNIYWNNLAPTGNAIMLTNVGASPLIISSILGQDLEPVNSSVIGKQYIAEVPSELPAPTLLNNLYCPLPWNAPLDPSNFCADPRFLEVDEEGLPTDTRLRLDSLLIDAGHASSLDPDGSPSDIGAYGGPGADQWDLDADGIPAWYWPGSQSLAPVGVEPTAFDCDDLDPLVGGGCQLE